MTAFDRLLALSLQMSEWPGAFEWSQRLDAAILELAPYLAAVDAFCSESSEGHWTGDAARDLHRAWAAYRNGTPAENGGER